MNTPAHAAINWLILDRVFGPSASAWLAIAIVLGSVAPDLPMIAFYAWCKWQAIPEATIWQELYYAPGWQLAFDLPHALPVLGLITFVCWRLRALWPAAFFAAMLLHGLADFPLHHDDSHRHLWPLTDWRFASPLSYWDPRHYGAWVTLAEVIAVAFSTALLWRRHTESGLRLLLGLVVLVYLGYAVFVTQVWM